MKKYICDCCGKDFNAFDEQEEFGFHYDRIGYGSVHDNESINVDMCCDCFDKIFCELDKKYNFYKKGCVSDCA